MWCGSLLYKVLHVDCVFLKIKTTCPIKPGASSHREDAANLSLPPSKIHLRTFVFNKQKRWIQANSPHVTCMMIRNPIN